MEQIKQLLKELLAISCVIVVAVLWFSITGLFCLILAFFQMIVGKERVRALLCRRYEEMNHQLITKKKMVPCPCGCGTNVSFYRQELIYIECPKCGFNVSCEKENILEKRKSSFGGLHFSYYYHDSCSIVEHVKVTCNEKHGFWHLRHSWFIKIPEDTACSTHSVTLTRECGIVLK